MFDNKLKIRYFLVFFLIQFLIVCDKKHSSPIALDESALPDVPKNITATVSDNKITLSWTIDDTSNVHSFHIYRKDTSATRPTLLDSTITTQYTDTNVKNGLLYYYQIAAVNADGYEGSWSSEICARSNIFDIVIADGKKFTNSRDVALKLTAPAETRYMIIANDSNFTAASWEPYLLSKNWTLSADDGMKIVYAKFRDNENNLTEKPVHSSIVLDTKAIISAVTENTSGQIKIPGQAIHFTIITGETEGVATIDIGTERQGIRLYDDGQNGDAAPNNGIYELDYIIPSGLRIYNGIITGYFTDRANNIAEVVTTSGRVTIHENPIEVTLFQPVQSAGSPNSLELYWSESADDDFSSYRLFRSLNDGVDTTSLLITTISVRATTNFTDTNLDKQVDYYYRVFVFDRFGMAKGSNEVSGAVKEDVAPTPVTMLQPTPDLDKPTSCLNLSWTKNNDQDFSSYKLFRSRTVGVDSASSLIATITDQNTLTYRDLNLEENTMYYYRAYIYDTAGLSSRSNEVSGKTDQNMPPTAVFLYPPVPVGSSLTSLNLSWSKNADNDFSCYKIFRSKTNTVDSAATLVTIINEQGTTNYEDTNLLKDTAYYYRIYVYDTGGLTTGSNMATGRTNANEPPTPVTLNPVLAVENSWTALSLGWSQNEDSDFASYKIFRSLTTGVDSTSLLVTTINTQTTTNYEDTNLQENTSYYYRVYVFDSGGLSAGSIEKVGTTNRNLPPDAVILAQPSVVDSATLHLSWSKNRNDDFSMYSIYRSTTSTIDTTAAPIAIINDQETTQYNDTNLLQNTTYFYRVFVTDEGGLATGSNQVSATPKP